MDLYATLYAVWPSVLLPRLGILCWDRTRLEVGHLVDIFRNKICKLCISGGRVNLIAAAGEAVGNYTYPMTLPMAGKDTHISLCSDSACDMCECSIGLPSDFA